MLDESVPVGAEVDPGVIAAQPEYIARILFADGIDIEVLEAHQDRVLLLATSNHECRPLAGTVLARIPAEESP